MEARSQNGPANVQRLLGKGNRAEARGGSELVEETREHLRWNEVNQDLHSEYCRAHLKEAARLESHVGQNPGL